MNKIYFPVVRAKRGEFEAFENLDKSTTEKILPLFDVPAVTKQISDAARFKNTPNLKEAFLNEVALNISRTKFTDVAIDLFDWRAEATIETGEHVVPYLISLIRAYGIATIPIIGYDRWDNSTYREAVSELADGSSPAIIRIDSESILDVDEPQHFGRRVRDILNSIELDSHQVTAMLDFGDLITISESDIVSRAVNALTILDSLGIKDTVLVGCSISSYINDMVVKPNSSAMVVRKEVRCWKEILSARPEFNLVFGDYCTRNPSSHEGPAPHANGKIKYTVKDKVFVARGHSKKTGMKGAQMYELSLNVITSPHYLGDGFSWGDSLIRRCSNFEFKGTPTKWIAIDTNHHITYVVQEVSEEIFEAGVKRAAFASFNA